MTPDLLPPEAADERTSLLGFLQRQRALVVWKCEGMADDDARSVASPSGLTIPRVVRHLCGVEHGWFAEVFAGEPQRRDRGAELTAPDVEPLAELLEAYRAQCRRSDEIVAGASLDDRCARRPELSLRWVLLHLVEETARHLGHLDLFAELADGRVGEEPEE